MCSSIPKAFPCAPARSRLSWLLPQVCAQERHSFSHKPASSRTVAGAFPKLSLCSHFQRKGRDGCTESRASRPGQVLCTLPRPPCQRKHKHPTQRKHFSSATQVPIFAQGWSVPGSFPHHSARLSQGPAELSGLGSGQSRPSCPTLDPQNPGTVTTSGTWRGLRLT